MTTFTFETTDQEVSNTFYMHGDFKTANECIEAQINALKSLPAVLHTKEYQNIIEHLKSYTTHDRRIIITGVGKNANVATKISETMASLGIPSFYLNTSHCGHGDYGFIGPKDTVIHISRSGKTEEMLNTAFYINENFKDVWQILVHCKRDLPMYSFFDHQLFCGDAPEGDEHQLAPTTSTTLLLCAMDSIACVLSKNLGFTREDFLLYHPGGALGAMLKSEIDNV